MKLTITVLLAGILGGVHLFNSLQIQASDLNPSTAICGALGHGLEAATAARR